MNLEKVHSRASAAKWSSAKAPRKIEKIVEASLSKDHPWGKSPRLKGARAAGKRYEKKVCRTLKRQFSEIHDEDFECFPQQWISFVDSNGLGMAQPDFYALGEKRIILFEIKLSQSPVALDQLQLLYTPLLQHIYARPVLRVQVFRHWTNSKVWPKVRGLPEILSWGTSAHILYWHVLE